MEKFPQPPPDKRLNRKMSQPKVIDGKDDYDRLDTENKGVSNLQILKQKNTEDLRKQILSYVALSDKKMFMNLNSNNNISNVNFVLFGPSGSGKSSFIRTLFKSMYGTKVLPPDVIDRLIIKDSYENEGTICFQRMILKEQTDISTGIRICDTRGHLLMNNFEVQQFNLIVEGKVKDNSKVVQTSSRNPFLLWEFWKSEENLFSEEILENNSISISDLPHSVILVFDGSSEDIINPDEIQFYRDLVSLSIQKGHMDIQIILTRVDVLEDLAFKRQKNMKKDEIIEYIHSLKDKQIEKVIEYLGVKRTNIHFVENYLSEKIDNIIEIDYQILKTLNEIISSAENFLVNYYNKNTICCF